MTSAARNTQECNSGPYALEVTKSFLIRLMAHQVGENSCVRLETLSTTCGYEVMDPSTRELAIDTFLKQCDHQLCSTSLLIKEVLFAADRDHYSHPYTCQNAENNRPWRAHPSGYIHSTIPIHKVQETSQKGSKKIVRSRGLGYLLQAQQGYCIHEV